MDASGKPLFGLDSTGPTATPEAVDEFLRSLEAKDWGASLGEAASRSKPKRKPPQPRAQGAKTPPERTREVVLKPAAAGASKPQIRDAHAADAARLADLINELGHPIETQQVRENLTLLMNRGEPPLVATLNDQIIGMCGVSKRVVITRPAPLGRITSLIVTKESQGEGVGRMLVEAAEAWMRKQGCQLVEVTSNDRRAEAHAFYRHMGYERTSIRFAKTL